MLVSCHPVDHIPLVLQLVRLLQRLQEAGLNGGGLDKLGRKVPQPDGDLPGQVGTRRSSLVEAHMQVV